jgi:hypothetical protein
VVVADEAEVAGRARDVAVGAGRLAIDESERPSVANWRPPDGRHSGWHGLGLPSRRDDEGQLPASLAAVARPVDFVPGFLPIVGQLDDAILVVLARRYVLRAAGPQLIAEHPPGPDTSRDALARPAFGAVET